MIRHSTDFASRIGLVVLDGGGAKHLIFSDRADSKMGIRVFFDGVGHLLMQMLADFLILVYDAAETIYHPGRVHGLFGAAILSPVRISVSCLSVFFNRRPGRRGRGDCRDGL